MKNSKFLKCSLALALVFSSAGFISGCKKDKSSDDSSVWLSGSGVPVNSVGDNGDFYFESTTKTVYRKNNGSWSLVTSFSDTKGILSVDKTTVDNIDTYTIKYSDGSEYSFDVKNGLDATELDFRVNDGYLQWSYIGRNEWNNLVAIDSIKGDSPVFEVYGNTIRWKYANENSWKELLDFSAFKGDKGETGTSWIVGSGVPTQTANVGDYYYDTVNNDIYSYSINGWVLYADLDSSSGIVGELADGVYTGAMHGDEFVLELKNNMVYSFKMNNVSAENIYNVSVNYEKNYIRIGAFVPGGGLTLDEQYIEECFVLKENNRLVKYVSEDEMELFKGVYYSDDSTPLTLSKNSFVYLYNGVPLSGEWEIVDVVEVRGVTKNKLLLKSENISFYAYVSYFDRTWQEVDVNIDFTSKEYRYNGSSIILDKEEDGYYVSVDSSSKVKVSLHTFSDDDAVAYIYDDNNSVSYVLDYVTANAYRNSSINMNFYGKTIVINDQNYRKQYYFDVTVNEFVPIVDFLIYSNNSNKLEYNNLNNKVTVFDDNDTLVTSVSIDSFTQETSNHYRYVDDNNVINLYFNDDRTLSEFSFENIVYAECDDEEDFAKAISDGYEFIKVTNNFTVTDTIEINKGRFSIDLNGFVISSGVNYLDGSIIKVDGNGEDSVDVKIKNGYLGNYRLNEDVAELLKTDSESGNISKYGLMVNIKDNMSINLENVNVSGYSTGLFTSNSDRILNSVVSAKNSSFIASSNNASSSAGAFLSGYSSYAFNNTNFEGATGLYAKSGRVTLINCSINGNGEKAKATYSESEFVSTGSAVVLDSSYGFSMPLNVSISGGHFTSANNYPIEKVMTKPNDVTVTDYVTVNGQMTAELYSAVYGTFDSFVDYNYAYVINEEQLREALTLGKKNIVLKSDIKVLNTIKINEGEYVIDLNGHILSSNFDYINDAIIRVQDNVDDVNEVINVTIKNGYVGNFVRSDDVIAVLKTNAPSGNIARQGIAVNGSVNTIVNIENVKSAGYETGFATNGGNDFVGATIIVTDSEFVSSMNDPKDGAGAYFAGYANYTFTKVKFVGSTGLYAKSGEILLVNCEVVATGDEVNPKYGGNGYWPTGSGLVVDSAYGYVKPLNVTIQGGSYTSASNYAIQEISTTPDGVDVTDYASVAGYESATLTGLKGNIVLISE